MSGDLVKVGAKSMLNGQAGEGLGGFIVRQAVRGSPSRVYHKPKIPTCNIPYTPHSGSPNALAVHPLNDLTRPANAPRNSCHLPREVNWYLGSCGAK